MIGGGLDDQNRKSVSIATDGHLVDCSRLEANVLRSCWWEELCCKPCRAKNTEGDSEMSVEEGEAEVLEQAACFVAPPSDAKGPAPVVLYLTGHGHVDGRQDFFSGGVDLLMRNDSLRTCCTILALRPMSDSGLLRGSAEESGCSWDEDAVWNCFTQVLQRLGSERVDSSKLYVTGISLGAAGAWNLALKFGKMLAAVVPISGRCAWPHGTWPGDNEYPLEIPFKNLQCVAFRAYQTDRDWYAGNPVNDISFLTRNLAVDESRFQFPGMDEGSECIVNAQSWTWDSNSKGRIELWQALGPLMDWSGRLKFSDHCLWYRVYSKSEWGFAEFLFKHSVPEEDQLRFHDMEF